MAMWKDSTAPHKEAPTIAPEPALRSDLERPAAVSTMRPAPSRDLKESIIGTEITITGKIDGAGSVRLAGRFEGDVHIQGDLTIEAGAKLTGSVRASAVAIAGEIEGNIESAARVELLATGVLNGDLKAGTLIVAAGSRMRGRSEFGWEDEPAAKASFTLGTRHAS